jgi:hypothetical protein
LCPCCQTALKTDRTHPHHAHHDVSLANLRIVENGNKIEDQELNRQAALLAARHDLPGGTGSDAHDPEGIGAAYLEMPDFDGPAEFLAALRYASVVGEYRPHAVRYARRQPSIRAGRR